MNKLTATVLTSAVGLSTLFVSAPAHALIINDFQGPYTPANWTLSNNTANTDGSVNTGTAPALVTLTGGNNGSESAGSTDYTAIADVAAQTSQISFNWNYSTSDFQSDADPFQFVLNGTPTDIFNGSLSAGTGTSTFNVTPGDTFGFRIATLDNTFGAGSVTISNFVAVPFEFSPTIGISIIGGIYVGKRLLKYGKNRKEVKL